LAVCPQFFLACLLSRAGRKSDDAPAAQPSPAIEPDWKRIGMHTLYLTYEEKLLDMMIAYSKVETSLRFSLTHGGRYLPLDEGERQTLLEQRAFALARLEIDRIMRLQARMDKAAG
jgi:hypothetical protein